MSTATLALVAVDWGTSHLRVWTLAADGTVIDGRKSADGMGTTARDRFAPVLEGHLAALDAPEDVPVVMCGMVGARQGWTEAGYLAVPVELGAIGGGATRVAGTRRDIRILPGLSKTAAGASDVMRGEETQLIGLHHGHVAAGGKGGRIVACLPGTHSKWIALAGARVDDFTTFMTGDAFAALSAYTVLRHSIGEERADPQSEAFRDAVAQSLSAPAALTASLFSIRSDGLLNGLSHADAASRLSGALIGLEIAGAVAAMGRPRAVELVGGGLLGDLYRAAFSVAKIETRLHDGEALVRRGLFEAARMIWPKRLLTESA